ncbi:MAG TPA: MOSC domain-containing protein [Alphaproteobacteria bacterium]|nr:MOSC domain-containing protein [Alphaproteobacteria bacterium]
MTDPLPPTLLAIARRARPKAPMAVLDRAEIDPAFGVRGDARGKPGRRQVTLLSAEAWAEACAALGIRLPWTLRRANLLVSGLALAGTAGRRLRIGPVVLAVTGETDPCRRMDAQFPGLAAALAPDWRGGVTCRVVAGGRVQAGDALEWIEAGEPAERRLGRVVAGVGG